MLSTSKFKTEYIYEWRGWAMLSSDGIASERGVQLFQFWEFLALLHLVEETE